MKSGVLKQESWVGCSRRKDKSTIIMLLGRLYTTSVAVVLITNTLLMEANMSEFSACPPGDRYDREKKRKVQKTPVCLQRNPNPKTAHCCHGNYIYNRMKTGHTDNISSSFGLFTLPITHLISSRSDLPVSTSAQTICPLCRMPASSRDPALQPRCLLRGVPQLS